jgi:hypothetical protein
MAPIGKLCFSIFGSGVFVSIGSALVGSCPPKHSKNSISTKAKIRNHSLLNFFTPFAIIANFANFATPYFELKEE